MPGPLAGVRVLELARILAGPWAGQILADLGADVVKVERKGTGDDTRGWGPPFVEGADGGHLGAAYFHATNRGKRSIELDFESEDGRRTVRKLAARSDVLIENFQVGVLANQALNYLVSGQVPKRIGNAHPNIVPYQVFPVADGHIIIATGNDNQFAKLCAVLGEPKIAEQANYRVNSDRLKHREELIAHLSALTRRWSLADLLAKLESVQVPAGPINPLDQVFADPQVVHRGMRIDRPSAAAKAGSIPGVRTPIMIDGQPAAAERPAPRLGEHTAEVLREIGEE